MKETITLTGSVEKSCLYDEIMVGSFSSKIDTSRKIVVKGTNLDVFLTSALTAGEITELNTIVTDHDFAYSDFITSNRATRVFNREEGTKYWNDFSDDLIYKVNIIESITINVAESIYNSVEPITHHLEVGSWFSAYGEALALETTTDFTQTIKDKIVLDMKTFVNANYPESMHIE